MQYVMKKTNYTYIMSPKNIKEHCFEHILLISSKGLETSFNNLLVPLNIEPPDLKWFTGYHQESSF